MPHSNATSSTSTRKKTVIAAERKPPIDDGRAFLPDPRDGEAIADDDLAETLAEEFLASATSAEEARERVRDAVVPEELGGPFIEESEERELATEPDESNPVDATVEPFPTAIRGTR